MSGKQQRCERSVVKNIQTTRKKSIARSSSLCQIGLRAADASTASWPTQWSIEDARIFTMLVDVVGGLNGWSWEPGRYLVILNYSTSTLRKPLTRVEPESAPRPSSVVSAAATKGVMPHRRGPTRSACRRGRRRQPRPDPRASFGLVVSCTAMACISLCFMSRTDGWRTPSRRSRPIELTRPLLRLRWQIAENQVVSTSHHDLRRRRRGQ
jgi:hypothetical protein